jgi:uncharacterized membrane protein
MKTKTIGYWVITVLLVFAMISGGAAELTRQKETIDGMILLGYPVYFVMIIGFWKILGGIVLLVPGFGRVKEWAYAGIFFNMTGAAVSHIVMGSAAWHIVVTLTLAALTAASWALRSQSRTLGELFPARVRAAQAAAAAGSMD